MNPDDIRGYPSVEIVCQLESLIGRRVQVIPNYSTTRYNVFITHFSGCLGTIVAHSPIMPGITDMFAVWYFTPDEGIGMIIPIDPLDVIFIDKE